MQVTVQGIIDNLYENWDSYTIDDKYFQTQLDSLLSIKETADDPKWFSVLSEIYHLWAIKKIVKIKEYAKQAMEKGSRDSAVFDNLLFGCNIQNNDFSKSSFHLVIDEIEKSNSSMASTVLSDRILVECLLASNRLAEAESKIDIVKERHPGDIWSIYRGELLYKKGNHKEAIHLWETVKDGNKTNYQFNLMIANNLAKYGLYEMAKSAYEDTFEMQLKPRKIDSLLALIRINEILGMYDNAICIIKRIVELYKTDYEIEYGNEIDEQLNEIERIKEKQLRIASSK